MNAEPVRAVFLSAVHDLPYGGLPLFAVDVADEPLVEHFQLEQEAGGRHALAVLPFRQLGGRDAEQVGRPAAGEPRQFAVGDESVGHDPFGHRYKISKRGNDQEALKNTNRLIFQWISLSQLHQFKNRSFLF